MSTEPSRTRPVVELYADKANRLGHAFAADDGLNRTDAATLRAERDGDVPTLERLGGALGILRAAIPHPGGRP